MGIYQKRIATYFVVFIKAHRKIYSAKKQNKKKKHTKKKQTKKKKKTKKTTTTNLTVFIFVYIFITCILQIRRNFYFVLVFFLHILHEYKYTRIISWENLPEQSTRSAKTNSCNFYEMCANLDYATFVWSSEEPGDRDVAVAKRYLAWGIVSGRLGAFLTTKDLGVRAIQCDVKIIICVLRIRRRFMPVTENGSAAPYLYRHSQGSSQGSQPAVKGTETLHGFGTDGTSSCRSPEMGQEHLNWRRQNWNNVLFTAESCFNLCTADGRERVYRRNWEWHADVCVRQRDRYGGGIIMVWGGIMGQRTTRLSFRGFSKRSVMVMKYWTPRLFQFCEGTGLVHCSKTMPALIQLLWPTIVFVLTILAFLTGLLCPRHESHWTWKANKAKSKERVKRSELL